MRFANKRDLILNILISGYDKNCVFFFLSKVAILYDYKSK